jgi:hypothetical protein
MTDFLMPRTEKIRAYRKSNPHRLALANLLLELEWELCSLLVNCEVTVDPWILMSAQAVHEYHCETFLFLMRERPVPAMALMRMACELSRDIFRVLEDQKRLTLWLDTSTQNRRQRSDLFRFDVSDPGERQLFDCWDFCSTFGVHRHLDIPSDDPALFYYNDRLFAKVSSDPKQINELFIMSLVTILLSTSTEMLKLKPIFELQSENFRRECRVFASSYFDRAEPVDRFIKAQRSH